MPLHRLTSLSSQPAVLGLWQLTESTDALLAQLPASAPYSALLPTGRDPERPRQWLAGRALAHALLQEFTDQPTHVANDAATGQPYLVGQPKLGVSLSHSGPWVAAVLAENQRVGTDVEIVRPKAQRLAPRFLSPTELADAADDAVKYSLYWSAKETLYKLYAQRGLIFNQQILLDPFERLPAGVLSGHLLADNVHTQHAVSYECLAADCVLTWTLSPLSR